MIISESNHAKIGGGVVVGVVLVFAAVGAGLIYCLILRKRRKRKNINQQKQ